ncbi:plastocyanin/azurin family copper-binding protein [Marinicella sp. W31]|uniref:cupredoxin domain-containing protein n=1 Tax=Marinicella sp. W31 TaxID=3023713 RepID=UPI003756B318
MISCAQKTSTTKPPQADKEQQPSTTVQPPEKIQPPEPAPQPNTVPKSEPKLPPKPKPKPKPAPKVEPKPVPVPVPAPEPKPATPALAEKPSGDINTISGQIRLDTSKIKDTDTDITSTVVYFRPHNKNYTVAPRNDLVVSTQNKRFNPNVLAIPVGSEVSFPNRDKILHNVFSVSGAAQFDLGLYSPGENRKVTFDKPGVIFVHCNVHHSMQADVIVLDTPWYVNVDLNGHFSLQNLPNEPGTLHVWHPRAQPISQEITSISTMPKIDITVPVTRQKVPKHLNKFGKSYRPSRK